MAGKKDLYEILGMTKDDFSVKKLKKNYRNLVMKYHPDRQTNKTDEEKKAAEEKFKEISHAYEVLSDEEKRRNYDMFGDENGHAESSFNEAYSPFGNFNPFADFDAFNPFGRNRHSARQTRVTPGRDIQMGIPVTIEELFNGTKKTVKYKKQVRCVSCHGKGGSGERTCSNCGGSGRVISQQTSGRGWTQIVETECPNCKGTGVTFEHKCDHCHGSGFEDKEVTLDIEFPPGIGNGQGVAYYGNGSESKDHRGENGKFIAVAKYDIDEDRYMIDGLNVMEHVHVPYYDVLLGCNITVNIPNGTNKSVKIKPCTTDGTVLKLSKEGIKDNMGHRGDYYICVHLLLPEMLSSVEKAHLEEIKRFNNK